MATGRKPVPIGVYDNKKARHTQEELEARANAEPKGCSDELKPPKGLSKEAKKEWNRLVKLYRQLEVNILNDLDLGLLAAYCESRAIFIEAQKHWQSGELYYTDKKGERRENPWIKIMDREGLNIAKYGEQLALSPVGRARYGMAQAKKEVEADPMSALLAKGKYG